jgi:transposase
MSTSPYSQDLRDRVINFIKLGNTQVSTAKVFSLNISTVNKWYLRYIREGNCNPRARPGAKRKVDLEGLTRHVTLNPDATLKDLAKKFGVSIWGIYYWLKKLGFSYKKKPSATWKQIKKSEMHTKKK